MGVQRDAHFVAGLIVGEGSFKVDISKADTATGVRLRPVMVVGMHGIDEDMLREAKQWLNGGFISNSAADRSTVKWSVKSKEDISKLIDKLDQVRSPLFESSHKWDTYQEWKKIVVACQAGEHHDNKERTKELIRKIKSLNRFGNDGRSVEKWFEIVDNA